MTWAMTWVVTWVVTWPMTWPMTWVVTWVMTWVVTWAVFSAGSALYILYSDAMTSHHASRLKVRIMWNLLTGLTEPFPGMRLVNPPGKYDINHSGLTDEHLGDWRNSCLKGGSVLQ